MKKKPLYKRIFKNIINIITFRQLRRKIKFNMVRNSYKETISKIESNLSGRIVYIFQHQFFDVKGEKCFNGGAERYVTDLADILTKNGYTPVLIQKGNLEKGVWERNVGDLKVIGLPVKDIFLFNSLLSLFRHYEFVIYSGATHWSKKLHPNILISHGVTWDTPNKDFKLKHVLDIFSGVDRLISVDTNTISWLRTTFTYHFDKMKMDYIPNYVDTSFYKPIHKKETNTVQITFPRRASTERGYWLMSKALPPILEKYPQAVFDFVGFAHGEKVTADIQKLITQFPGRVHHYVCEPSQMYEVYQKTDISLVPTLYAEGTSLSCLEAQACGNVVIATNIGGLPNLIIDGYNGLLINPSEDDLLFALDKVMGDKTLRKKMSSNVVLVAKAFDKTIWENRWNEIFKEGMSY